MPRGRHVISCDKFFSDRLRGVDSVRVENCPFPLTKPVAVNTWAGATAQPVMLSDVEHQLQLIHTVNGDGSKTAKIIKRQC